MNRYTGHFIGGPLDGARLIMEQAPFIHYVPVSDPPLHAVGLDERDVTYRKGVYRRSARLSINPVTFTVEHDSRRWVYEWAGFES